MTQIVMHSFAKALGSRKITNDDLSRMMETSDEWITQRTGIKSRFWAEPGIGSSDLAVDATRESFKQSGTDHVDAIIAATLSPDHYFPGIGVLIQTKLGLKNIPAFDIRQQCSGFLYGIQMAHSLIKSGTYKRILLVGSEVHSTGLDISTRGRDLAVLFGDGAGSCIIEEATTAPTSTTRFEIIDSELHSDGADARELWCELPGSVHFTSAITPDEFQHGAVFPKMNGRRVFENAVKRMTEVCNSLLSKNNIKSEQVSHFIPHQANTRINEMVANLLQISPERCFNTIQNYGNTTAATIPIGFTDAISSNRFKSQEFVLSAAFGSGFTWGSAIFKG